MGEIFEGTFRKARIANQKKITSEVFFEMSDKGFKGVAIVDDYGKIVATLSPSDLKGITAQSAYVLNIPVIDFLEHDNSRGWWWVPITFSPETTFFDCLQQFVCSRIHRMYMIDSDGKPIGVISHRDMLQKLLFFNGK